MSFGDRLDVGDRTLRAVAPPTFDNPTSTGLLDEKTGTLFSVDCFGAILPEVATDCAVIPPDVVRQGMTAWLTMDSPWTQLIDREKWDAVLDVIRRMAPNMIMSSHLPAATGTCETFLDIVRALPDAEHMPAPNNEQFQQMLARGARQPFTLAAGREHHRHSIVQRCHRTPGCGGEDRAGAQRPALIAPHRPQPGERERLAIRPGDVKRLARTRRLAAPLVEAVGDDQAARPPERLPVGGPLLQRLGPGVDHLQRRLVRV